MYHALKKVVFDNLPETYHIESVDELHVATKWAFCQLYPEYMQTVHTFGGEVIKAVFSESPSHGINQAGMSKYFEFSLDMWAQMIGVSVEELVANRRGAI
jgi:hypothetical protein